MSVMGKTWLQLVLSALLYACETGDGLTSDAGRSDGGTMMDAAPYDGDAGACQPAPAAGPVGLDPQALSLSQGTARWLHTDDGVLVVAPGADGRGYQVSRFTSAGEARSPSWSVFPSIVAQEQLALAAAGGVLAIAERAAEAESGAGNTRRRCRLSLLRMQDQSIVQIPTRVSDPTEDESVLNEAALCDVTALDAGFVVVWQQSVSRTSDEASLFAQRVALDGTLLGERVTLLAHTIAKQAALATASDGTRAVIVYRGADQTEASIAFVEADAVQTKPLPGVDSPFRQLARAHDGFLLRTAQSLWQLDREGAVSPKAYALAPDSLAAPLGDGYVEVKHEEFLVARSIDATLSHRSQPFGVSDERSAQADALVFGSDGDDTVLIYREPSGIKLLKLGCGTSTEPLGPKTCPRVSNLQPLAIDCTEPVCHALVRLDYLTLGVRGWAVRGGPVQAVDAAQAARAAQDVFTANDEYITNPPDMISGPEARLYYVGASPSDFGGFALVGEQSGLVVAAGGVVWGGRGSYWIPSDWRPASEIRCGDTLVSPAQQTLADSTCHSEDGQLEGKSAAQAMNVALSSNVALTMSAQGELKARAFLYTPSTGICNAGDAEWLVVLTRQLSSHMP